MLVVGIDSLHDAAGALLQAGAARRHRRLRHARQGRQHPPHAIAATSARWRRALAERVIEVEWGAPQADGAAVYPVDVVVEAADRQGLLRDISEVFAKEKMNVIGVQTQIVCKGTAWMTFTVEIDRLGAAVRHAARRCARRGRARGASPIAQRGLGAAIADRARHGTRLACASGRRAAAPGTPQESADEGDRQRSIGRPVASMGRAPHLRLSRRRHQRPDGRARPRRATASSSCRRGTRNWPRSWPARTPSSPARSACAWPPRAPAPSTCSTACTTPRPTTSRSSRSSASRRAGARRRLPAGSRPRESLFKDVAHEFVHIGDGARADAPSGRPRDAASRATSAP